MRVYAGALALSLVAVLSGCGTSSSKAADSNGKADEVLVSVATSMAPSTSTTILTPPTTMAPTLTAAQIESQVRAFYVSYANLFSGNGSNATEQNQTHLEQKYFDPQLVDQIARESPTLDYSPIECAQNVSNEIVVKVIRLSEGTYDAIVTATYGPNDKVVIPVRGAADSGKVHSITCSSD